MFGISEPIGNIILIYGLLLIFYIPFILLVRKHRKSRFARRRFFRGVVSVFENCQDDRECVPQIQMLYKRLSERYSGLSEYFRSTPEMMEDLICSMDTSDEEQFKSVYRINPPREIRSRMVNTLNLMKSLQPFSSLSSKEANLLNMLQHAIDTSNFDLARSNLSQLADEIEILEGSLRTQSRRNRISFTISTIGVILTIFFGLVAFLQFVVR